MFQDKINIFIPEELAKYGTQHQSIFCKVLQKDPSKYNCSLVEDYGQAHFAMLPVDWSAYYTIGIKKHLRNFYENCNEKHIPVISYNPGDHGVKIPNFANHPQSIILRQSGYRSNLPQHHRGCPVFWLDPLKYLGEDSISLRDKSVKPVIGFCGHAIDSIPKIITKPLLLFTHNMKSILGLKPEDMENWFYPPTRLRMKALRSLEKSQFIQTNFILRQHYKAGVRIKGTDHEKKVRTEFYNNMLDSDYILCIRGTGNFSVRFYETLAMGRIPLVVETDQMWPLEDIIQWSEYGVFVPSRELHSLPARLLAFHNALTDEDFKLLQLKCRKLWEEKLTLDNFLKIFLQKLMKDTQQ